MSVVRGRSILHHYKTAAGSHNLLSAVALNAAQAARTLDIKLGLSTSPGSIEFVIVGVDYTFSAATDVRADVYGSLDGGATYKRLQSSSVASGLDTLSDYIVRKVTGSANQSFAFTLAVDGCTDLRCIFSGSGSPGAGDLITVQASGGCR